MAELDRKTITKIQKLFPMLTSDHAGEVSGAVAAILRTLTSGGCSIHDLAARLESAGKPTVIEKVVYRDRIVVSEKIVYRDRPAEADDGGIAAATVLDVGERLLAETYLSDRERSFVENMMVRAGMDGDGFTMTAKQIIWFRDLSARPAAKGRGGSNL
jgi:hypothetical protein